MGAGLSQWETLAEYIFKSAPGKIVLFIKNNLYSLKLLIYLIFNRFIRILPLLAIFPF